MQTMTQLYTLLSLKNNTEMAELLLNRGANVNAKGHNADTALHVAASESNTDMVTLLLEREAETDAKNHIESTALHIAAKGSNPKVVALLLNKGAMVNILDNKARSPIDLATKNANLELAKLMLDEGSNVSKAPKFKKNTRILKHLTSEPSTLVPRPDVKTKLSPSFFKPEYNESVSSKRILEQICIESIKEPRSKIRFHHCYVL
jgi:ankyrin repeat protein